MMPAGNYSSAAEVQSIALSLPDVTERTHWGKPSFRVRDKIFAVIQPDGVSLLVKAERAVIAELVDSEPDTYATPPNFTHLNYMLVRLDRIDRAELRQLLAAAWRCVAPKRLVAQHPSIGYDCPVK